MITKNVIGFYKPSDEYGYMSNWYMSDFEVDGIKFSSGEQYMMHSKAILFGDAEISKKILNTDDVAEIKALGRKVRNYDEALWSGMRHIIVYNGLLEKFRQNDGLRKRLLSTKDDILAECAPHDRIWGIGLSVTDEQRLYPELWNGQNLLGFALMCVREQLRKDN